jgi:hypothetical protein
MPMILKFGLLMVSVSSCIFLSRVLSCILYKQVQVGAQGT